MSRPVLQFTRLTNASRLADRFLACQVREFYESGLDGQARLFVIVEIVRPWLAASQIGQALIAAFQGGYHDASTADDVKQVEAGLKRVNETLVHLTNQGETEWVGHLHALFALEKGGAIHVAQTGRAGAVLVREDSVSRITELEGQQSTATANRTFGTITSGEIAPGDSLVIGSGELFRALGNDVIAEGLKDSTAAEAVARFARILRQHQTRSAAAIVVRAYDAKVLADQPLMADPEVIYLDEQPIETLGGSLRTFGRRIGRLALAGGHHLSRASQSMGHAVRTKVAPRGKALLKAGQKKTGTALQELKTKHLPNFLAAAGPLLARAGQATKQAAQASIEQVQKLAQPQADALHKAPSIQSPTSKSQLDSAESGLIGKDLYTVRHYTSQSTHSKSIFAQLKLPHLSWSTPRTWLISLLSPKHRPRLYALLAGVLLIILVMNISLLRARQQQTQESAAAAASVTDLRSKFDDAKLKLALKSDPSVAGELQAILTAVEPLTKQTAIATAATALQIDVQDTLDTLTKSTRIRDPKFIAKFDRPTGLFRLESDLVTAQSASNKLQSSPIAGQLIDDRSTLPTDELPSAIVQLDQANTLVFISDKGNGFTLTKPGTPMVPLSLTAGSWEPAIAGASFFDNLYLLDPATSQIWKHTSDNNAYSGGNKFITDGTDVSKGISLAIDGSIFVLTTDGSILKFTQGRRDGFTLKDLPPELSLAGAQAIWTDSDTSSLYVLTKTAIIELAKTGSYNRRYILGQLTDLSAFVVDPSAKQAWVLNGDTAYEVNLTGA